MRSLLAPCSSKQEGGGITIPAALKAPEESYSARLGMYFMKLLKSPPRALKSTWRMMFCPMQVARLLAMREFYIKERYKEQGTRDKSEI